LVPFGIVERSFAADFSCVSISNAKGEDFEGVSEVKFMQTPRKLSAFMIAVH
jgi:hypothetical protein